MTHFRLATSLGLFIACLPAAARAAEKRVVTYVDGPQPRFDQPKERRVRGPLELEVRFQGANPLCYRYSTNIGKVGSGAGALPKPVTRPVVTPVAPATFANADEALTALRAANDALEEVAREARQQASLTGVWADCESGGNFPEQRSRVESAASTLASKLADGGAWRVALTQAGAAARGALDYAGPLADAAASSAGTQNRQRVEDAERALANARSALEREKTVRPGRPPPEPLQRAVDTALADLDAARRAGEEADRAQEQHRAAPHVVATAERLAQRRNKLGQLLDTLSADVALAQSLIASVPGNVTRTFPQGETVQVAVVRTPMVRGRPVAGALGETVTTEYETLSPIILDVGFGPALTIGQNTEDYDLTVVDYRDSGSRIVAARTERKLIMDGLVSFSAYIWGARYLDDTVFDTKQLLPRPMFGLSTEQPFESVYAGLQIDPIQFIDISGGVRWMTTERIIGQQVDTDNLGGVAEPQTREEVRPRYFVAVTFSTDLFWRWAKRQINDIKD